MERLVCILIGYVCGLFQTGYIYGKIKHVDIRQMGSGNAGTTNALRTLGFKAGLITFLGDCLKAVLAAFVVRKLFGSSNQDITPLLVMYAGLGTVLGHNFPFYLGFKGGKGIAATAGMILSFNGPMAIIGFFTFVITVAVTRYVSLGSLLLMAGFLIELFIFGSMGNFGLAQPYLYELYAVGIVLTALAFYRHRQNIVRLANKTERKLGQK
ncbi:glycerol-3-phosphate 1-O-acyltransferase PlsY [Konateibacter massiliensis]|uniref:glycerol-3-phosphate 1-O-acyltransferase PlsY n=1 Tax=Konateibacter massiliensis TaxID=2002841 RepID=UPI000C144CEC|nr:glycerol-3-phosphate 1-O-acyltransferase PlsY [Konateibacter massiliensis]